MDFEETSVLTEKWEPVLEGIGDDYTRRVTAQLLENQAKTIISDQINESLGQGTTNQYATTVGSLGTFQKFAFPLVRRVYPELIANSIVGVQPMSGPVSQVFYLGHNRAHGAKAANQVVYSKYNLTYRGLTSSGIGSTSATGEGTHAGTGQFQGDPGATGGSGLTGANAQDGFDSSNVMQASAGGYSSTVGGKIAGWPDASSILGWTVSTGENLAGDEIPEINFHIQQQAVVARTRKMRALWTLEASQDLRAYHDLDLERELTDLLSKELALEIDRELIEDLRMVAYDVSGSDPAGLSPGGTWNRDALDNGNPNSFGSTGGFEPFGTQGNFTPSDWLYDFSSVDKNPAGTTGNVWVIDFAEHISGFAPQHMGHVYSNLLAIINLASQDIYKTTWRGPGSWLLTSPLMASLLESAAKLEGGVTPADKPSNIGNTSIEFRGKFAGRYDLYVDPLYPDDEILIGYKGANAMDAGFVYSPYIPLQQLPTITDPETFQPRKGILTRYGKAAISPESRFYRVIRLIGPTANWMFDPFAKNTQNMATNVS